MASPTPQHPRSEPPAGTRHRQKKLHLKKQPFRNSSNIPSPITSAEDEASLMRELETLPALIKQHFKTWKNGAHDFQEQCMRAQVLPVPQDVILHAATGSGKTGIAAGPHLLPSSKGKVTLFISPLLALHDEQVSMIRNLKKFILLMSYIRSRHSKKNLDLPLSQSIARMEDAPRNWQG